MTRKTTPAEFVLQARAIHGNKYDYSKVDYTTTMTPVVIACPTHGDFSQKPHKHLSGHGCRVCGIEKCARSRSKTTNEFVADAMAVHGDLYDYSRTHYVNSKTDVEIGCPVHGWFTQNPADHTNLGNGCARCGGTQKLTPAQFIAQAREVHGELYDYSAAEYSNFATPVEIICRQHGSFWQKPNNHISSRAHCPKCGNRISSGAKEWLILCGVSEANWEFKIRYGESWLWGDGYEEATATIYEFLGDFWHGNPRVYNSTAINPITHKTYGELLDKTLDRFTLLDFLGYKIRYVWEMDFKEGRLFSTDLEFGYHAGLPNLGSFAWPYSSEYWKEHPNI